jgi:hypothetical protein
LKNGSYAVAAWFAGAMTHYIDDVASWPHVLATEAHEAHSDFENQVSKATGSYAASTFAVTYDGTLETISASDAATALGQDTSYDGGKTNNALWMDQNFQSVWTNVNQWSAAFKSRATESLNLAVNTVADVLHTLTVESGTNVPASGGGTPSGGEGIQIPPESIAVIIVFVAMVVVGMFVKKRH